MTSYGDPQSARARARVPGPSGAATPDEQPRFETAPSGRAAPDAYRNPSARSAGGRASVGAGPAGRASVGVAQPGRASVGSASVGSASVGVAARPDTYRAAAARAAVRPVQPGYGGLGERPGPDDGPGGGGPGGGAGGGRDAGGLDPAKRAKKRRRTNILTAAAAVVVILLGAGVVAGTWFFDGVDLVEPKVEDQSSIILAADNSKLGTIGDTNRSVVPEPSINRNIEYAVMGAEDKNFLDHHGIDMKGIARAAWNNFTGGDTQGASTITQQYARHIAKLKDISYNRKLREAVLARKLESAYNKNQILGFYLNAVYFGRGAYGIEAAAQAYFGKSAVTPQGQPNAITVGEAAVLASVIKQPEPVPGGHQGYDPQRNLQAAKERWDYTLGNMVEKGWLKPEQRPTIAQYPKYRNFNKEACRTDCGADKATGKIKKYVTQELEALGLNPAQGGLRIKTTIDPKVQAAAEEAVSRTNAGSPMHDLGKTYKSALVAVSPKDGRVLAYYGGDAKSSWDYAGMNPPEAGSSGRPPGSSFKIYTLLAALKAGYGFDTTWNSKLKNLRKETINNSSRTSLTCDPVRCPLAEATIQSYNFPFYWLANFVGPAKVAQAAHQAGISRMWTNDRKMVDLSKIGDKVPFSEEVGFGQFPIMPVDHANGMATIAADGVYNKAHFVRSVEQRDEKTGAFKRIRSEQLDPKQHFDRAQISDLDSVLQEIPGHNSRNLDNGRPAIAKTGTWELNDKGDGQNGDAWMVGATRQVSTAVWVGNFNAKGTPLPIKTAAGRNMTGGSVPGAIWKMFMDAASRALDAPVESFPDRIKTGNPDKTGNGLPPVQQPQNNCIVQILCGDNGQGNNGGQGNGQGNNGGQGNGQGNNGGQGNGQGNNGGQGTGNGQGNGNGGRGNGNGQILPGGG